MGRGMNKMGVDRKGVDGKGVNKGRKGYKWMGKGVSEKDVDGKRNE
jgi:hypothetical protein